MTNSTGGRARINYMRLWVGGLGTAVVAALIVIVGVLLIRGVFGYQVLAPSTDTAYGNGTTTTYALFAAGAAIAATAVLNVLLLAMPQPTTFFSWIVGLATAAAVLLPFTVTNDLKTSISTAAINLVVGLAVMSLLGSVANASIERPVHMQPPLPQYQGPRYNNDDQYR